MNYKFLTQRMIIVMMKEEASKEQEEEDPKKTTSVKENVIWRPHKPNQGAGGGSAKTCSEYVT